jgi:hypothetical protein
MLAWPVAVSRASPAFLASSQISCRTETTTHPYQSIPRHQQSLFVGKYRVFHGISSVLCCRNRSSPLRVAASLLRKELTDISVKVGTKLAQRHLPHLHGKCTELQTKAHAERRGLHQRPLSQPLDAPIHCRRTVIRDGPSSDHTYLPCSCARQCHRSAVVLFPTACS